MIENAVKVLNELLEADPGATNEFFRLGVTVNTVVCDHPTIQVRADKTHPPLFGTLRPLGLINGLLQEDDKVIVMVMNDFKTTIAKFVIGVIEDGKVKVI